MKSKGLVRYRGVSKKRGKYQMSFPDEDGVYRYGGLFKSAEEAARAHDQQVILFHGPNALTNERMGLFEGEVSRNPYTVTTMGVNILLPSGDEVLVDVDDYAKVHDYYWYTMGRIIAAWDGERHVNMARLIAEPDDGEIVVHLDGDVTDNRRENLEVTTRSEWNRSRS